MFKAGELLNAVEGRLISGSVSMNIKGISIDSRTIKKDQAFIAIKGDNFDGHNFIDEAIKKGANCIITAKPVLIKKGRGVVFIEVRDTIKALGDIARFWRQKFNIPFIAITGSNGKTTTKDMIAWVLSKSFKVLKNEGTKNNQIGLPLTLLNLNSSYTIAVLELGTNHFGEIEYLSKICLPNIGVITNIGPAHLEYFGDLAGVFKEKYALIENLKKPYVAVLNADDSLLKKELSKGVKHPFALGFGIEKRGDFSASGISISDRLEFRVNQKYKFTLDTLGFNNIYNALAAVAVGRIFGIEYNDIAQQLAVFDFPQGRLRVINSNNVRFIDDTYNSNPASLKQALEALYNFKTKGRKIFVMGDMLELGSRNRFFHQEAGKDISKCCDIFITVGNLSKFASDIALAFGFDVKNVFTCESAYEARNVLFNKLHLKEDDVVLVKGSRAMKMEEIFKVKS